ncbi:hypothetical protein GCM10008024_40860 [Allgaiera indica]|uniref:Uncharacterized protein n=1 Tax=Allgaiera indica TaxID=765699 RepID=A0AAN4UVL3_9RHOB|nr:hypothetical protein [Allgaiera indica]GHE06456.1 hypothetical protein GCM10008024_40860 [Allgaiera indica]
MDERESYVTPEALQIMRRFPALFSTGPWTTSKTLLGWGFSCGLGWYPIIERLSTDLSEIVREDQLSWFQVSQVKQKFGELRFYVRGGNNRTAARIREAVEEAATTCERCGHRPAELHNIGGMLATYCPACCAEVAKVGRS